MYIQELLARYGLKTRQSIYKRCEFLNITLAKESGGRKVKATPKQVELLDRLHEQLKKPGARFSDFSVTTIEAEPVPQPTDSQIVPQPQDNLAALTELLAKVVLNSQAQSIINPYQQLELAMQNNWLLASSELSQLIGIQPRGKGFSRGCWQFIRQGKIGRQSAWRVSKDKNG